MMSMLSSTRDSLHKDLPITGARPAFGLVLTIHPINENIQERVPSLCSGRVFAVPESERDVVMTELDFREKEATLGLS